jgi:hypothetical protein
MNLQDLWLINSEGNEIFHHSQSDEAPNKKILLNSFFAGVQQFASELGGNKFYHIENDESIFVGTKIALNNSESSYLIAKCKLGSRSNKKKIEAYLDCIEKELQTTNQNSNSESMKQNMAQIVKKNKI